MLKPMTVRATIVAILAGLAISTHVLADPQKRVDIPAGELRQALLQVSEQFGADLVFSPEQIHGIQTRGAHGELTTEQAVTQLLEGTPLELRTDPSGAMLIAPRSAAKEAPQPAARAGERIELEEIVVTGSHIRGLDHSASPTFSLTAKHFQESGATTVQEALRSLPQNFTGGASDHGKAVGSGRNGNDQNNNYGAGVNLRGLGNGSTLVLLNGQRLSASGLGAFVDVSTIPLTALERIDVITDGASAIYGSDAVGGVVNFILRDDFDGAETSVLYGSVTEGELHVLDVSQLIGKTWQEGAAFLTLDYQDRTRLDAADRGYASALTQGPSDLIPQKQLWSALFNGHQNLGTSLQLAGTFYFNKRESDGVVFSPAFQGLQSTATDTRQAGGTLGLEWSFTPTWTLDLSHTYSRSETDQNTRSVLSIFPEPLVGSTNYIVDTSETALAADGALFDATGGPVRLALGASHRSESLARVLNGLPGVSQNRPRSFDRDIDAVFAEVNVPLIGSQNAQRWATRLDLTAAVRHEEYSDFGSTSDPKVGLVWSPLNGLSVRATYGTSFRAPHLNLFDDSFATVLLYRDAGTGSLNAALLDAGSRPDLGPESATTWTAGFDVRPQGAEGLLIGATYFQIDYEDRIANSQFSFSPAQDPLLRNRVATPPDPAIMSAIAALQALDPSKIINISDVTTNPLGAVQTTYDARYANEAFTNVSGVDLTVEQPFDTAAGRFRARLNASYLFEFENQPTAGVPPVDVVDTVYFPVGFRFQSALSWSRGSWSAAGALNYVDSYRDNQTPTDVRGVASWTTFDLCAAYTVAPGASWASGVSLRLNVQNALDRAPPTIFDRNPSYANPGYDTENANPLGRYVSFMLSKAW